MPPENWCGKWSMRCGRRGDAGVLQQADGALARLGFVHRQVGRMVSISCRPTVYSGFSEVSGSWKIAPILRPRMCRIASKPQVVDALAFQQDLPPKPRGPAAPAGR
jgi:hypothetical protein